MFVAESKGLTHQGAKLIMAERWTALEGGVPVRVGRECIGGVGVSGGDWETDLRIARMAVESIGANWE